MNEKKVKQIRRAVRTMMPDAPWQRYALQRVVRSSSRARFLGPDAARIVLHPECQKSKVKALKRSLS